MNIQPLKNRCNSLITGAALSIFLLNAATAGAQSPVTGVITDYNGYWNSSVAAANTVTPDTSHMLLAFTYKNKTYSTGVADATLNQNNVPYTPANFEALGLVSNAINGTGCVIGVGDRFGGNGNVQTIPVTNDLAQYLNDGAHGLDLGTAIFNLPASTSLIYKVSNFRASAIGDSIPDILLTQVGQPPAAGKQDEFHFEDSTGKQIGQAVSVGLAGFSAVGSGKWKFYNPGNPITYNAGLAGTRPLRMMGFDLADFGIRAADIGRLKRFVHKLSGESDQAFIAYNKVSFDALQGVALPVKLVSFDAEKVQAGARLSWSVAEVKDFDHFEIERIAENTAAGFNTLASIQAYEGGQSSYEYTDASVMNGNNYYRLKMVDKNGTFAYSPVRSVMVNEAAAFAVYPNPAAGTLYIKTPPACESILLVSMEGKIVATGTPAGTQLATIDVSGLPRGIYQLHIRTGDNVLTQKVMVVH